MPSGDEFFKETPKTSTMLCANFGEGKTSVMVTFPKFYYIGFRQAGLEVLRKSINEKYKCNLIRYEEMIPATDEELKAMFSCTKDSTLVKKVLEATEMAKRGEIASLCIDDLTDGIDNCQKFVWTFEKKLTQTGQPDTQSMYGQLKINVSNLFDRYILPFRKYGNLVLGVHLMRESEQTVEGVKTRAGAVDKSSDIYPDIVGSFRREVQRKLENVLYLESKSVEGKRKFRAYTEKQVAMGTTILAKNVLGLAPIVEDVTYDTLMKNQTVALAAKG